MKLQLQILSKNNVDFYGLIFYKTLFLPLFSNEKNIYMYTFIYISHTYINNGWEMSEVSPGFYQK